jgi:hypothetical protein
MLSRLRSGTGLLPDPARTAAHHVAMPAFTPWLASLTGMPEVGLGVQTAER